MTPSNLTSLQLSQLRDLVAMGPLYARSEYASLVSLGLAYVWDTDLDGKKSYDATARGRGLINL